MTLKERFWSKVRQIVTENECWVWGGAIHSFGYGSFHFRGRTETAHRRSYMLYHGRIPKDKCVLHRCDNPRCVNPAHLYLGTKADNAADMIARGRRYQPNTAGEHNGRSKLTISQIQEIRELYSQGWSTVRLAKEFGISQPQAWNIAARKQWQHVA